MIKFRCNHNTLASLIKNDTRDEMATPIAQSVLDEEMDRQIAEGSTGGGLFLDDSILSVFNHKQQQIREHLEATAFIDGDMVDSIAALLPSNNKTSRNDEKTIDEGEGAGEASATVVVTVAQPKFSTSSQQPISSIPIHTIRETTLPGKKGNLAMGNITPQSPIFSEWHRWLKAGPPLAGGDLITELEALRKHTTEGLYTTEVSSINTLYIIHLSILPTYAHFVCYSKICCSKIILHAIEIHDFLIF